MLKNLFKVLPIQSALISPVYRVYQSEEVERNGVLTRESVLKTVDVSESLGKFDYRDFSIGNLIAVGAYRKQPCVMVQNSDFGVVDKISSMPLPPQNPEK